VRQDILAYIRCPICHATDLSIAALEQDEREIREGQLICLGCDHCHPIHKGIVNLLPNPNSVIQSEQQGWVELLGETHEGLVETMLELPYLEDGAWITTYKNFDDIISKVSLAGKRVLDIGAGRCWSTRRIVMAGASYAVGLDILLERFIGLETADIFLQHDELYFERVLGDMNNLPIRPGAFDIAFMTGTLHHSSDLVRTMRQVTESLVPGGMAIVINEPVHSLFQSKDLTGCPEVEHGINEHVYTIFEYLWAVWRAGLRPKLFFPRSISQGLERGETCVAQGMGTLGHRVVSRLRRRAMCGPLLPVMYLIANMPLVMVAGKPL
jgi:SAM-dependent methyltransferase